MRLSSAPLLTARQIQDRVKELAIEVSRDFADGETVIVAVLKGAVFFAADFARALTIPVSMDFIRARSYVQTRSAGEVEFTLLPDLSLANKQVLVVEDIVDTGRTTARILEHLAGAQPARLALCALLDKPARRVRPVRPDYVGFTIRDFFVVGYGLDYEEHGREIEDIYILE